MSEIQAKKFSTQTLNGDGNIQFWANTDKKTTQRLQLDASGNLCFGTKALASQSAHIPPPDGVAPMYSARAWGHIITDATSGEINTINTKLKNVQSVMWEGFGKLKVTFTRAMPSTSYIVVANCNLNATNPLLVSKVNADSTALIMYLNVYDATGNGGSGGSGPVISIPFRNFKLNSSEAYPQLLDFAVFA
jgi:hypothetical protein